MTQALVLLYSLLFTPVQAPIQEPPPPPYVLLARICWSEVGARARYSCAAVHTALRTKADRRARACGSDWTSHARAYTRGSVFDLARAQPSRPWLVDLHPHAKEPAGWPSHLPWSGRHRERWTALLAFTKALEAKPFNPCDGVPWDWGHGRAVERYRRESPRAVEITCPCDGRPGRRCNVFLRPRPRATD